MHLTITDGLLERFVGGHFEVKNLKGGYHLRGPIKAARFEDETIFFDLHWTVQKEGGPRESVENWTRFDRDSYIATLACYTLSDLGNGRWLIRSFLPADVLVLFPPGDEDNLEFEELVGRVAA